MLQSRYYYFLMYLNFIVSMIEFTPTLIYAGRYKSSLISLLAALLLAGIMILVFEMQLNRFQGQSISKIMKGAITPILQKLLFVCSLILSYWIGFIYLISFAQIAHKYISPELSAGSLFMVFLLLAGFSSLMDSKSTLFMLEIVVVFSIPVLAILILVFTLDPNIRIDFILEAATYIRSWPSYPMLAAGAFLFNGYMARIVFNEHLKRSKPKKWHLVVVSIGLLLILAYYFIPIGYLGLGGIKGDDNVWFTTMNSMKLPYFFIERFIVVFLMMQIGVSLMFVIICWHSSLQFLKFAFQMDGGKHQWISFTLLLVVSYMLWKFIDAAAIRHSISLFLNINLAFDLAMIGVLVWCAQRGKAALDE
ncbi:hypothetical protein [Paenibacillus sp. OV219]|uniref:hypothetical protein n=1 Tax=Paenibacillus sp. OV219 TaxID=1884377 RepID=UPI0008C31530|nr:hypothetical protein [Paenibacillus sp. OV219]SEO01613.1 hypothetical protein SAMN05518847_105258 [Paenibacillus sp. OV219]